MKHGRMVRGPFEKDRPNFPIQAEGTFQLEGFKSDILSCNSRRALRAKRGIQTQSGANPSG